MRLTDRKDGECADTRKWATLILLGISLLLALGILWPALKLALLALSPESTANVLTGYNLRALRNTLGMGFAVATLATVLGFIVAYALEATRAPGRAGLRTLYVLPLLAPSVMPATGLIYLIGSNGLLMQCELYGALGVLLGSLVFALPQAVLQISASLATMDNRLIDVARSLGAGPVRRFLTVTLVQCRRGLANAFLVTFVLTVTDFGVPKLLGGSLPMLATEIYGQAVGSQNFAVAAILSVWLLIPSLFAFWCLNRLSREKQSSTRTAPRADAFRDRVAGTLAWGIVLAESATILVVVWGSFVTFWPYVPDLTLENFAFKSSTYGITPWWNSLKLAFGVAVLGTFLSWLGAYAAVRAESFGWVKRLAATLIALPLCIPGTVLGLGQALAFNGSPIFSGALGGMALLVLSTLVHLYTVPSLSATTTLSAMNPSYEMVGRTLGVSTLGTIRRVVLPLSTSCLKENFTYLFATAVTTISAVVFLYNPKTMVAAVAAIDLIDSGFISEGAAMCTLVFLSALVVRLLTLRR